MRTVAAKGYTVSSRELIRSSATLSFPAGFVRPASVGKSQYGCWLNEKKISVMSGLPYTHYKDHQFIGKEEMLSLTQLQVLGVHSKQWACVMVHLMRALCAIAKILCIV